MSQLITTYWEMLKLRVFKTPTIHIVTIYCANIFFGGGEIVKGDLKVSPDEVQIMDIQSKRKYYH